MFFGKIRFYKRSQQIYLIISIYQIPMSFELSNLCSLKVTKDHLPQFNPFRVGDCCFLPPQVAPGAIEVEALQASDLEIFRPLSTCDLSNWIHL
jgi:hypothetical protein